MNVRIKQIGFTDYQLAITHLVRLFYQEATCEFVVQGEQAEPKDSPEQQAARADVELSLSIAESLERTEVIVCSEELIWRDVLAGTASPSSASLVKRALFRNILHLLEQRTGIRQPWGILTGVRPTKLMHNLQRAGSSREACLDTLTAEYLVAPKKAQLLAGIVDLQRRVIPDLYELQREVSLYIGIPFCPTKCAYCTFPAYDIEQYRAEVPLFLEALVEEIRVTGGWLRERGLGVTTVYWGGGTPTSISAEQMALLLDELEAAIPGYKQIREVTVEAGRPDTITVDKVRLLKQRGVHRMSINPQSFTQQTLDQIGRHHTVEETIDKFLLCREQGMDNLNMDLIIGLPDEGMEQFAHTIAEVEKLMPESLTVHTLSFKRASNMTKRRDEYDVAEGSEITAMMALAEQWTVDHGYNPYYLYRQKNILGNLENVGYALPGHESLYNILMMEEAQTVIGIGCGAVSKIVFHGEGQDEPDRLERFANPKEPAQYNASWRDSLERKLRLLDEAYPLDKPVHAL